MKFQITFNSLTKRATISFAMATHAGELKSCEIEKIPMIKDEVGKLVIDFPSIASVETIDVVNENGLGHEDARARQDNHELRHLWLEDESRRQMERIKRIEAMHGHCR